jgi:lipopolysaccharide/colanic/teichoic acid biosynthesis glycosyltransferase
MGREPRWRRPLRHSVWWPLKRAVDVAGALLALVVTAPLMVLLAVAVRLSSRGPVLLRQARIGLDGIPFDLLKFRSMRVHGEGDTLWSVAADDPRVTAVGRFMRRSALDELPQLVNVLRGDMSLVGPRPERPLFAATFAETVPGYAERHRVRGGLTGWAQIHGLRGNTSIAGRTAMDLDYIDRWSPWRDVVIIARTVPALIRDASLDDAPPLAPRESEPPRPGDRASARAGGRAGTLEPPVAGRPGDTVPTVRGLQ